MKIAIASLGDKSDSQVDARFGRCPFFAIADTESGEIEFLPNTAKEGFRGVGISTAQMIADKKAEGAAAGNFGPNAVNVLTGAGIKIYSGVSGLTIKELIEKIKEGEVKETKRANVSFGPGMGRGMGKGGGGGRRWQ